MPHRTAPSEKGSRPRFEFLANVFAPSFRLAAAGALAAALALGHLLGAASGQETATLRWHGATHPVAVSADGLFSVPDVARAFGFSVSTDPSTGVLTLTGDGHTILVGPGTAQVPVDDRIVSLSRETGLVGAVLFAPGDFIEKIVLPLVRGVGSYDAARRLWMLTELTPAPLSVDVAIVHVAPTTQVVLRQSAPERFVPTLTEESFQIRWPGQRIVPPFAERQYEDPFVAAVRFSGETASIQFREPGLAARAYPLTDPDRIVIEVGRLAAIAPVQTAAPMAPPPSPILIVLDPGHGGEETGAIGPGGLQEKEFTLQLARRLASTIPRMLAARVLVTRDSDSAISLDDRTSVANHEKADLFLSLHANSSRAAGAHGSETYYLSLEASDRLAQEVASRENQGGAGGPAPPDGSSSRDLDFILWDLAQSAHLKESSELAEAIQDELNVVSKTENRGIKQAPFRVLVGAAMPAVLVEAAFISNPEEEKSLRSPAFQQSVAEAISRALARFFLRRKPGAVRITFPTPTPPPAAGR